jgi:hypothetical protein
LFFQHAKLLDTSLSAWNAFSPDSSCVPLIPQDVKLNHQILGAFQFPSRVGSLILHVIQLYA